MSLCGEAVAEILQDFCLGELKMALCKAAYLVLILLIQIFLDGFGWPSVQLQAHFARTRDTIPSVFRFWQQNLGGRSLAEIFLALTLFSSRFIQLESSLCLPLQHPDDETLSLLLASKRSMISYVGDECEEACSPHHHPCSFDSVHILTHLHFYFTVAGLLQHFRRPYQYFPDFHLEAFCSALSRLLLNWADFGCFGCLNRSLVQSLVSKSLESGTFAILVDRIRCILLNLRCFGSDHGEGSLEPKLVGCHYGQE